jgi:pyridinium-3,5-bisthiocarboxylic acid mononucleotide nickel chelatase
VMEVAANIDDDTGEHLAWLAERLLAQGALDVWMTPAVGKKGRPLTCFQFLAAEADFARLADWFLRHSTTFGVRHRVWDRLKLERRFEPRPGPGGTVTHKVGLTTAGEELKAKPEFEELRSRWERPPA